MRLLMQCMLCLATLVSPKADAGTGAELIYLGSFSHTRASGTGHVYIYEFRLWQSGSNLHGVVLSVTGLEGGGLQPQTDEILSGSLTESGIISFATNFHTFQGEYSDDAVSGVLQQGGENVWGGTEGSDRIELSRGAAISTIPPRQFTSVSELRSWLSAPY